MGTRFTFDKTGIKDFAKEQKRKPYKIRRATADVLSAIAYQTKLVSFIEIDKTMTVRSKRFVQTALRYKRAKPGRIDGQESSAFSIERDRFSGWAEQMGENRDKRTRTQSLLARSKSFEKKVAPRNRAKPMD